MYFPTARLMAYAVQSQLIICKALPRGSEWHPLHTHGREIHTAPLCPLNRGAETPKGDAKD